MLTLKKNGHLLTVDHGGHRFVHDLKQGGAISRALVKNGPEPEENLLLAPAACYAAVYSERQYYYPEYSCANETSPKVETVRCGSEEIVLRFSGMLRDKKGGTRGIAYLSEYSHHPAYVRITQTFNFEIPAADINQIGVVRVETVPKCNRFTGLAPLDRFLDAASPMAGQLTCNFPESGTLEGHYYPPFLYYDTAGYLSVFEQGGNGIELIPDGDLYQWRFGQPRDRSLGARSSIQRSWNPERSMLILEPFFSPYQKPPRFSGKYSFTFFMALPDRGRYGRKNRVMWVNPFSPNPWPDSAKMEQWRSGGVSCLVLHNDNPDVKLHWPDGLYPPYDRRNMLGLDRCIADAHRHNLKIVPYFSCAQMHPKAPYYKANSLAWARLTDRKSSRPILDRTKRGVFGGQMCLDSGWYDQLGVNIEKVLKEHEFDGLYFDWVGALYCENQRHSAHPHVPVRRLLEHMERSRQLVGRDGIIISHQSLFPSVALENMVDLVVAMEDVSGWFSHQRGIPSVDQLPPYFDFMNVAPRALCAYTALLEGHPAEQIDKLYALAAVKGFSFYGLTDGEYRDRLSTMLSRYDLSDSVFYGDLKSGSFVSCEPAGTIRAALYVSKKRLLLMAANVTEKSCSGRFFLRGRYGKPRRLDGGGKATFRIAEEKTEGLIFSGRFKPYQFTAWEISRLS